MKYYCDKCEDELCIYCVDFPWECPEQNGSGSICKNCEEELVLAKMVWVNFQREAKNLRDKA